MAEKMFHIENLDKLLDVLNKKFPREFERTFVTAMRFVTFKALARARINSPVDTGRLRASLFSTVEAPIGSIIGIIGSPVEYASFVEKPGNVLGVGRRPFLEPAFTQHMDDIERDFLRFAQMLAKKLGF